MWSAAQRLLFLISWGVRRWGRLLGGWRGRVSFSKLVMRKCDLLWDMDDLALPFFLCLVGKWFSDGFFGGFF